MENGHPMTPLNVHLNANENVAHTSALKIACFTSGSSLYTDEILRKTSDTLLASETST